MPTQKFVGFLARSVHQVLARLHSLTALFWWPAPLALHSIQSGQTITALRISDGWIRPIAVGLTLHRLVAKRLSMKLLQFLDPFSWVLKPNGSCGSYYKVLHIKFTWWITRFLKWLQYSIRRNVLLKYVREIAPDLHTVVYQTITNLFTLHMPGIPTFYTLLADVYYFEQKSKLSATFVAILWIEALSTHTVTTQEDNFINVLESSWSHYYS